MGTQQILLIVLSVIIVGVAIAVGISMFNSQAYNSNKTSIAADAQSYATQVLQYYKTPESQGGAGSDGAKVTNAALASYLGLATDNDNENGEYAVFCDVENNATTVRIYGLGTAERGGNQPKIVTTVTLANDTVTAAATDVAVATTLPTAYE